MIELMNFNQWQGNPAACLISWVSSCKNWSTNADSPKTMLKIWPWSKPTINKPIPNIPIKKTNADFGITVKNLLVWTMYDITSQIEFAI